MEKTSSSATTRISSFVLLVIFITIALSFAAIILAVYAFGSNPMVAGYLLLIGFVAMGLSIYILLQTRKRISRLKIKMPSVTTMIECRKCGFKNVREFQRGDYIFKEDEPCQKCKENMLITAIYREVTEKKEKTLF